MAGKQQAFAKDITSATEFEQELQLSWKEGGITVVDVYSTIWGPCRAIQPTFRRLFLEADDTVKLRFLTADSTLILKEFSDAAQSIQTSVRREIPRPKNLEAVKETLPAHWTPILQAHEGKPKPLFLFWKEGRLAHQIEGVHTPEIVETVKNLAAVRLPADDFLTNPLLLDNWCEYFSREDSEVKFDNFVAALSAVCMLSVPLTNDELTILREALKVGRNGVVSAANLQKWVGNEMTLSQAFARLLPGYEERAMTVRLQEELNEGGKGGGTGSGSATALPPAPAGGSATRNAPPPAPASEGGPPRGSGGAGSESRGSVSGAPAATASADGDAAAAPAADAAEAAAEEAPAEEAPAE